jgi:uncharacterized protein YbjT (DUF2867 family)
MMLSRVFLTGGSGFVGRCVLRELAARRVAVNALARNGRLTGAGASVRVLGGSIFDATALDHGMQGCNAVIHLVGIIIEKPSQGATFEHVHFDGTRAVVDAAKRNNIRRYIHMSAHGTRANAASEYHRTKWNAEQYVRDSGLGWTIFRPSLIHGPGGFMKMEARWARKAAMPFIAMPYFGSGIFGLGGAGILQPVYVGDVALAFVDALENPRSIHKTYDLTGPDRFTWPQLHEASAVGIVGKRRLTAPLPAWLARLLAGAGLGPIVGFTRDQVIMSQENNTGDTAPFKSDFGWEPGPFLEALREYAGQL